MFNDISFCFQTAELRQQLAEHVVTAPNTVLSESQGTNNFDASQDGSSKLKGGGPTNLLIVVKQREQETGNYSRGGLGNTVFALLFVTPASSNS